MGYKADALINLNNKGLSTIPFQLITHDNSWWYVENEFYLFLEDNPIWGIRTDYPYPVNRLLPCIVAEHCSPKDALQRIKEIWNSDNLISLLFYKSIPINVDENFNAVVFYDNDVLYGEISFDNMTLRDAWTKGTLKSIIVDGSVGDFIKNKFLKERDVYNLRRVRKHIEGMENKIFELTVTKENEIYFWQELNLPEHTKSIFY